MPVCTRVIREVDIVRAPSSLPEGDEDPYVCRILATSPKPDSHRTSMGKTTRDNVEKEGDAGVPACHGHVKEVVYGSTRNADQNSDGEVFMDYVIERDVDLNHHEAPYRNSNELIRMIKNKHITKASVGLFDGWYWCNHCQVDMFERINGRYQCLHWPGDKIVVKDEDGKDKVIEIIPEIRDAHLGELSTVWAGSNPDAVIVERAEYELENGLMTKKQARSINRSFGMSLDIQRAKEDDPEKTGDTHVPLEEKEVQDIAKAVGTEVGKVVREAMNPETDKSESSSEDKALEDKIEALTKKVEELEKKTVDSEKADFVSKCRQLYLKLRGDQITSDKLREYEDKLDKYTISEIKEEEEFLTTMVEDKEKNAEGNRSTTDKDQDSLEEPENPHTPDEEGEESEIV